MSSHCFSDGAFDHRGDRLAVYLARLFLVNLPTGVAPFDLVHPETVASGDRKSGPLRLRFSGTNLACRFTPTLTVVPVPNLDSNAMLCDGHQNCVNLLIYTDSPI